ncbi:MULTISPECIES: hypothetical protein [Acinetobacter calcoaceticus/baumannii complex]|uniref:hypothetical protein n=1 Tax=Acinetobacter calcoaceticus/baumannii complex TaxID=909768 RepID=UPI000DA86098|nr:MULTISPECIES: hypothetical protein [Acinetobacter calcoaceticus/baumannii complex]MBP1486411.1 hypothetical protein [Acinetobacter nosocomialis]MDX8221068.1 hypothetical protein [Acinetobacter pittii]PZL91565.1 hypothetical protein DOL91_09500 [Acinetobacter baumannii]WPP73594.1 hypothetical protein SOI73_00320 [Acinetobacter pittii]
MVLIPRSSGRNMPRPTLQQHTPITGLGSISKAVDDVLEARKEEKDKKEKADFALQSSKIGADINVVDSDLTLKIQTGELPYEEAVKQRQQSLESIKTQYKTAVPKQFEQSFNNYFEQHSYQSASKYLPIAQKSEQQQAIVQLKDMRENYLKNPNASEKEVWNGLALYAQSKGLPLAHVQDTFNEYKNNRSSNDVAAFYLGNKSDNAKLTELTTPEAVIAKHPNLTQEQAVYWSGRALTQMDQNKRAAALQQKQLDDDAKDAVNEMKADIETGLIPSEAVIKARLARVQGTQKESEFVQYSGALVEVQQFMRLGADEREAYLSKKRSEAQNTAQDNAKDVSWKLNLLSRTHDNMLGYEKNNSALAYSIKTGQDLTVVPTNAILSGSPEAIAALSKNIKSIHANNILDGTVGSLNPFSTQQQSELKQFWEKARPGDKLSLLTSLHKSSAGNANAARDMINSIAGESGAYRLSASLNSRGLQDIAGQIITGQDLLDKNLVKVDDNALRTYTATYLAGITSPGKPDFQIYLESVKANYAYLVQKSEKVADSKGSILNKTIDEDLFNKAILNVTGGKFTSGGFFGSKSVVLRPHTVGEKSFREQLESFNSRNARNYGGSDKDFFLDLPLEQDPKNPYVYYFKNGTKYIMDATDKKRQKRLAFTVR